MKIILSFFTGELLTAMPNVSYFFEPLWFLSRSNKSQEPSVTEVSRVLKIPFFLAREFNSWSSSNFEIDCTNSKQQKRPFTKIPNQFHQRFCFCNKAKTMVFWYQNCSDLLWKKNWSSEREKLLKFEAEDQEFAKFLRSLEQFIQTVKD